MIKEKEKKIIWVYFYQIIITWHTSIYITKPYFLLWLMKEWLQNKESDIRYNAIYNLPYMIKFYEDKEPLKLFYLSCLEDLDSNIKYCAVS